MRVRKTMALLVSVLLALAACTCAFAETDEGYEGGDPAFSPELMLRTGSAESDEWTCTFLKGDVVSVVTEYRSMEALRETDTREEYEGEGGYTLARIDGVTAGIDALTFVYSDASAPLSRLSVAVSVDEDLNVTILAVGTDDALLSEITPVEPIHPVLLLAPNPASVDVNWVPDNSLMPGLNVESVYIPATGAGRPAGAIDMELVTLSGTGDEDTTTTLNYGRDWAQGDTFLRLTMNLVCHTDTGVDILGLRAAW